MALLPDLSHTGSAIELYFARPIVGVATALLLPLLLRTGSVQRGRSLVAIGLLLLSCSCVLFAAATSFSVAFVARCLGAVASALITVPLFYVLLSQVQVETLGWRVGITICGAATGSACGPWIGSVLGQACDLPAMMLILAITAAAVACVHLAVSGYVLEEPTNMEFDHAGLKETVFHSLAELLRDAKSCTLLGGVALSAAVLALHATLMPHYLGGPGIAQDAVGQDHAQDLAQARAAGLREAGLGRHVHLGRLRRRRPAQEQPPA
jgi:MFS family permease